jgi:NAD(P)-dependent dehydrogenase (short-subunit alcohol dehydrogenase family)
VSAAARTAIVTGATSGIGEAAALALGDAGWWVLAGGRDPERGAKVAAELDRRSGGGFAAGDVADPSVAERLVDRALHATGRLDLLVYGAGIHFLATVERTGVEQLERLLATNLVGAVLTARAAIPAMRSSGGGVIVMVGSEAGIAAVPGQAAYNVSKAALAMLTKSIAVDHAADGIRAVCVCPGTTRTPLVDRAIQAAADPEAHERALASTRPLRRLGTPGEIAAAIVFAASDQASFMTGSELVVDGGYTAT